MPILPGDQSSLIVPVDMDAWVVTSQNTTGLAWYYANYQNLKQFRSPVPGAFESTLAKPAPGVHLHWALPDALTQGSEGSVGTTSADLEGDADRIALAVPGAIGPAFPGMRLVVMPPDGTDQAIVTVTTALGRGEHVVHIQPHHFAPLFPTGSVVRPVSPGVDFPLVPNRWLISRFQNDGAQWKCKLWVIRSDFLTTPATVVGSTAAILSGSQSSVPVATPGLTRALVAGQQLEIVSPDGNSAARVSTLQAVPQNASAIPIVPYVFTPTLVAGSSVRLAATSAFLNPEQPTYMTVEPGKTTSFAIQSAQIGTRYTVEAWETEQDRDGNLFLSAVGPGDATFAAYVPLVRDVFAFTDSDLPAEGTGVYHYSYMLTGWYSDPSAADPLRGVGVFIPGVWANLEQWENETPAERFQTLLTALKWSVSRPPGTPPSTSIYHSLVADVVWPWSVMGQAEVASEEVMVAVGNTAIDAVAALINSYAQAEALVNPNDSNAWLAAGETLTNLMQAAQYDLLDNYGKPGGAALIEQQIHQAWYGSEPGGTVWEVVSIGSVVSGEVPPSPNLTPEQQRALDTQLAALNAAQIEFNQQPRTLSSLQADLYMMWWTIGRANSFGIGETPVTTPTWKDLKAAMEKTFYPDLFQATWNQYCAVAQAQAKLPNANDQTEARQWAEANWTFPKTGGGALRLTELGLKLKPGSLPRFWHPNDPVVLFAGLHRGHKHGEDGRFSSDGRLFCRLPGETITGIQIAGQPQITVAALQAKGINLDPGGTFQNVPAVSSLVHEAFLADPLNASMIAKALGGDAATIQQGITDLMETNAGSNQWIGTPPVPFSLRIWTQAWSPLFMEWSVQYFPTGSGSGATREFSLADWTFDGDQYKWNATGFDLNYLVPYKGRSFLTPQAPLLFKAKIEKYLAGHPDIDTSELKELIATVANWDIVSQSLSGFNDQLITRFSQEAFPPPPSTDLFVSCPPAGTQPSITALIGEQFQNVPVLTGSGGKVNYFYPVRGGVFTFQKLQVVDEFGQTFNAAQPNTPQGFQPILGQGLAPTLRPANLPYGAVELSPCVIDAMRLDIRFNANDGSRMNTLESGNPNGICGWLLLNYLDGGLAVYDQNGVLLGELLALPAPNNWRPRPGPPGSNPPPGTPAEIPNPTLRGVAGSIASQTPSVFRDVLRTIDETLWMVDPLGGRKDQFLSVLIGRPLAVVEVQLALTVDGNPSIDRTWNKMVAPPYTAPLKPLNGTGVLTKIPFPVRLGSLQLRDDGVVGYYLPSNGYQTLYSVHYPEQVSSGDTYLRPIVKRSGNNSTYQGDIYLRPQLDTVSAALILDPRGSLHAYTGILPVTTAALPGGPVEEFIRSLKVTFYTGPIIAEPGTLRQPLPAEDQGVWRFLERTGPPADWIMDPIVDAADRARLPSDQLQLREGWLELSGLKDH
jgi:hypothetical protein